MRRSLLILIVFAILAPSICFAKRLAPKAVAPVVVGNLRIEAPLDSGRLARIQVFDRVDGHPLWSLVVFENQIDPRVEEDVQWRFIETMKAVPDGLEVSAEGGLRYRVDLSTHKVVKLPSH